jgi:hypothetical protein
MRLSVTALDDLPPGADPWRAGPCRQQAQFAIFYKAYSKKVDSSERPGELVDEHRRVMRSGLQADQVDALPSDFYPEPLSLVPPGDRLGARAQRRRSPAGAARTQAIAPIITCAQIHHDAARRTVHACCMGGHARARSR